MSYILTITGKEVIIDKEDLELTKNYTWAISSNGYADAYIKGSGRKNQKHINMHRLIMGDPKDKVIDHINRNKLDNRKSNLRIGTFSQNMGNSIGYSKETNYKGINRMPNGHWRARINIGRKTIHLGVGITERDAAKLYNEAAIKHYGEFALTNKIGG